nr:hypothetical protein REQ54_01347 [Rhizobium sp. Q54]
MNRNHIIATFAAAMAIYVVAVFLWPSEIDPSTTDAGLDKTARLAGLADETAFQQERFGVPSPERVETRVQ